jgi:hypothetical protein
MQSALRLHDRLMREALTANGGHVFKTMGDAFCAAFATPESAAAAALDAQRALGAADFSAVAGLRVRMAINTGTADERDGDYFGPALNRVARLLALGHGGQVLLSRMAADLVRENPPPQATLADLGEHVLKDIEGIERVYQLVAPELPRDFPALRSQHARWHLRPVIPNSTSSARRWTACARRRGTARFRKPTRTTPEPKSNKNERSTNDLRLASIWSPSATMSRNPTQAVCATILGPNVSGVCR